METCKTFFDNEDRFKDIMFLTIPALFGYFLHERSINLYLTTLAQIEDKTLLKYLIIPLYISPTFLDFTKTVFISHENGLNLTEKYFLGEIKDEITREQFKIDFFSNWVKYIKLFPKIIKDAICCQKDKEKQKELFYLSFNEVLKTSPETLYFNLYCLNIDISQLVTVFDKNFCDKLWEAVLLNYHSLTSQIFMKDQFSTIFTTPEIQCIKWLYDKSREKVKLHSKIDCTIYQYKNSYLSIYTFTCPDLFKSNQKPANTNQSNQSQENDIIEREFREILLKTSLIELPDDYVCDPFEILRMYVPNNNEILELQIEDLMNHVDNLNKSPQQPKWTFERLLNVVRVKFEQRTQERLNRFQDFENDMGLFGNLTSYNGKSAKSDIHLNLIPHSILVFRYQLIKKWIGSRPLDITVEDINANWENLNILYNQFKNWLHDKQYTSFDENGVFLFSYRHYDKNILYNFYLQKVPIINFLNCHDSIQSKSRSLFFSFEAKKNEIIADAYKLSEIAKKIASDEELMEPHIKELKTIYELHTTPLIHFEMLYTFLINNTATLLKDQGGEGADDGWSLQMLLLYNSNSINMYSVFKYIEHFLNGDSKFLLGELYGFWSNIFQKIISEYFEKYCQIEQKTNELESRLSQLDKDFSAAKNQENKKKIEILKQSIDDIKEALRSLDNQ